jgi:hypothetical protein
VRIPPGVRAGLARERPQTHLAAIIELGIDFDRSIRITAESKSRIGSNQLFEVEPKRTSMKEREEPAHG